MVPKRSSTARLLWLVIVAIEASSTLPPNAGAASPVSPSDIVLVYFRSGVERPAAGEAARVTSPRVAALMEKLEISRDEVIRRLEKLPEVFFAEKQPRIVLDEIPRDPGFCYEWGMHNTQQECIGEAVFDEDVDAPEAWDHSTGAPTDLIGIIDEGLDYSHPDLLGKVVGGSDGYFGDVSTHGTQVAGVAAAWANNSSAAPYDSAVGIDWEASIYFRDMNATGIYWVSIPGDVIDCVNAGCDVINCSWHVGPEGEANWPRSDPLAFRAAFAYARSSNCVVVA
jgi:subtilisin family serine protease